jgi:VCBS repeat-containing protein
VYNNEPNNGPSSTPPEEIEDAPNAIRRVADRVHAEGLKFVSAPSFGLMIKIVNDVDWEAVNPEIVGLQLQRAPSVEQIIEQFNEKSGIIRQQDSDTLFIVQFNPEWQTIDDVKHVLSNTNGEIGGISVVCNFDSCTQEYLDEILALRNVYGSEISNNPPIAIDDSYNTQEDTTLIVTTPKVLFNDSDPESDSLTAVMDSNVTDGTLHLNSDGSFSYNPNKAFSGNDTFTYHAFDGKSNSEIATVTIIVNPVDDSPEPPALTGQLFFDGFEDDLSNWEESNEFDWVIESEAERTTPGHTSGNQVLHADNCDNECTITMANSIDLSAHSSANLSFWRFVDRGLDSGEYLKIEAYDGSNWNTLFFWSHRNGDDNKWHQESIDLTDYLGVSNFNLRFVTHESHFKEEVEVDDVLIVGY